MSRIVTFRHRFVRMFGAYTVRRMPPLLETGVKSGLFIALSYVQNNPREIRVAKNHVEIPDMGNVTHQALIKQACAGSLETSSQLLTFTVNAFIDVSSRYRMVIQRHISLMTDLMDPNISEHYKQQLWDNVMDSRVESQELLNSLQELSSLMDYVTKLATASAEVSYMAGAEFISTNMCERINSISKEFQKECDSNKATEEDFLRVQAEFVKYNTEQADKSES